MRTLVILYGLTCLMLFASGCTSSGHTDKLPVPPIQSTSSSSGFSAAQNDKSVLKENTPVKIEDNQKEVGISLPESYFMEELKLDGYIIRDVFNDGKRILIEKVYKELRILDTATGESIELPYVSVGNSCLSPDNTMIGFIKDGFFCVMRLPEKTTQKIFGENDEDEEVRYIHGFIWSPDSKKVLISGSVEWSVKYYIVQIDNAKFNEPVIMGREWTFLGISDWIAEDMFIASYTSYGPKDGGEGEYREIGYRSDVGLYSMKTDKFTLLTDSEDGEYYNFQGITSDKKKILITLGQFGWNKYGWLDILDEIILYDLSNGEQKKLIQQGEAKAARTTISPNGNWVIYKNMSDSIVLVSTKDDKRYILTLKEEEDYLPTIWSADSNFLYFGFNKFYKK